MLATYSNTLAMLKSYYVGFSNVHKFFLYLYHSTNMSEDNAQRRLYHNNEI